MGLLQDPRKLADGNHPDHPQSHSGPNHPVNLTQVTRPEPEIIGKISTKIIHKHKYKIKHKLNNYYAEKPQRASCKIGSVFHVCIFVMLTIL